MKITQKGMHSSRGCVKKFKTSHAQSYKCIVKEKGMRMYEKKSATQKSNAKLKTNVDRNCKY